MAFEYFANENLQISAGLFDYSADDLIQFQFDPVRQGSVAVNIGRQEAKGGEFGVKWKPLSNWTLTSHYSFVDAIDKNGEDVGSIPRQMLFVSSYWKLNDHWRIYFDGKWIGDRKRAIGDNRPALDNHVLVNSKISYRELTSNMDIALIFKNLFDEEAYDPSNGSIRGDYPLPGRHGMLEVTYHF